MSGFLSIVASAGGARPTDGPDQVADLEVDVLEPDFTLITLPTTLRLPQGKFAFRLTHRFSRSLAGREGDGGLVKNFFGFDSPAIIGIEFRYGLLPGTQVGFYRSNTRHIQLFARQNILWQRGPRGIGLDIQASLEGLDNLSDDHGGSVQAILSKRLGNRASVYIEPTFVSNVNNALFFHPAPPELDDDDDGNEDATFMVGLGARLRVRPTVYLVGEFVPRVQTRTTGSSDSTSHASSSRDTDPSWVAILGVSARVRKNADGCAAAWATAALEWPVDDPGAVTSRSPRSGSSVMEVRGGCGRNE